MRRFFLPFFLYGIGLFLVSCGSEKEEETVGESTYTPYHNIPEATYVGLKNCTECHEEQYDEWLLSDHYKAMNPATEEFVLGDFDDAEFDHFGQKFRFFRKGEEYWINAQDENGEYRDMKVDYTFGHYPLQQYLIPFEGGRYQALQVCWDSRPVEEGGQRWYHLYPDEEVPADDLLHWTRKHFNWNYMCADCHSTNLDKGFDTETLSYHTTWSDMNVTCEACHGPGSEHVKWAEATLKVEAGEAPAADFSELRDYVASKGLVVTLKEPEEGGWTIDPETNLPKRTTPIHSDVQVETCARCHSHRQLGEPVYTAGKSFHDTHLPSIISDRLYHHDGQVDEEVYVYGSYVQSKMFHADVRCTDCHNPHSMKLKLPGNALCLQCHQGDFNTPAHHFHPMASTGASCVECHMPETTYMGVDDRRDHSIRIPRPDLAKEIGAPDACTQCHEDQSQDWAIEHFKNWWGSGPRNAHYGEILASARQREPGSMDRLLALANDPDRPWIVRAAAVETIGEQRPTEQTISAILKSLEDPEPGVRAEGLSALLLYPAQQRTPAIALLEDPVAMVRAAAARAVAVISGRLDETQKAAFEKASADLYEKQSAIFDRAAGHMDLALFYSDLNDLAKAEEAYRNATKVEPEFVPAQVNLAELLYQQNRPKEAEEIFRRAVKEAMLPENQGLARDSLARFLIRMKRYDEGVEELRKATELMPNHAQTHYFYGVALNSLGRFEEAIPYLQRAQEIDPYNVEYLVGLATILRDGGKMQEALRYAREALQVEPENPNLRQLVQSLGG
ncbi:MAG: ammonia-forming cytochrome c nitrite reductase subunit c552 [Verrucomicrobiales bacterium]|nr:ammonia-forming cytochrome c nitrite reductase subunit c552 [Verrucomicrobiales bacterium]